MVDFDEALNILENKARRAILKRLAKEPHYPLQLSELLEISQQAVVKHLRVLEEAGFVESEKVPSVKGGPPKKMYTVNQSFCPPRGKLFCSPQVEKMTRPRGKLFCSSSGSW